MKSIFYILSIVCLFLISCDSNLEDNQDLTNNQKEIYIKTNVPKVLTLGSLDVEEFKNFMQFDVAGKLSSWNNLLLKKAYENEEEYTAVLAYIVSELGGRANKIIVVDSESNEKVFYPQIRTEVEYGYSRPPIFDEDERGDVILSDYIKNHDGYCTRYRGHSCVVVYN